MKILESLNSEDYALGKIISYPKNKIIFYEQEKCNVVCFIIKGEIKISSYLKNGNEEIFNHLYEGEMFANALIFNSRNMFLGNVVTIKETTLFILSKENLLLLMQKNKSFLNLFCSILAEETLKTKVTLKYLSKQSIEERFCYYLLMHNKVTNESVQTIANKLFLQRPSLSRVISSLKEQGVIKKEGKRITLLKDI